MANAFLIRATESQQPILVELLELYCLDFVAILDLHPGPDGRFGYKDLPLYWTDPSRHPFLIELEGQWAGFALVRKLFPPSVAQATCDMTEFFILPAHRRLKIGTEIAHQLWNRFPGPWQIRVMEKNHGAHHFWKRAISEYIGKPPIPVRIFKDGRDWSIYSFPSPVPV